MYSALIFRICPSMMRVLDRSEPKRAGERGRCLLGWA
jgi:hypothetical protein